MKALTGLMALVLVASLFGASEVYGAFGGGLAGKTKPPALTATLVVDLTADPAKGNTGIRVERSGASAATLFQSAIIAGSVVTCANVLAERAANFDRFKGLMNTWVPAGSLAALVGQFGDPVKAAITDTDYAACTSADGRDFLSMTAIIRFAE